MITPGPGDQSFYKVPVVTCLGHAMVRRAGATGWSVTSKLGPGGAQLSGLNRGLIGFHSYSAPRKSSLSLRWSTRDEGFSLVRAGHGTAVRSALARWRLRLGSVRRWFRARLRTRMSVGYVACGVCSGLGDGGWVCDMMWCAVRTRTHTCIWHMYSSHCSRESQRKRCCREDYFCCFPVAFSYSAWLRVMSVLWPFSPPLPPWSEMNQLRTQRRLFSGSVPLQLYSI